MPSVLVRSRRLAGSLIIAAGTVTLAGCSLGGETTLPPYTDPATTTFATSTGVVIPAMTRLNANVYSQDVTVGTGRVVAVGDSITVYYKGALSTGFVFATLARPTTPFVTVLDSGLIKGWNVGLVGIKTGGIRRLAIGPESAYRYSNITDQNTGAVLIPSNSVLAFDIEVVNSVAKP
jgi:FKBP-type peptidyl-prolyl cis-trans isomerase